MNTSFAYTFGALDGISVDHGQVSASGWVIGLEGEVTDLTLRCNDKVLTIEDVRLHQASPDVFHAHPDLPGTANCRFRLAARLAGEAQKTGGKRLFSIVPQSLGRPGVPLERIDPLQLKPPAPDQAMMVGHGDFIETSFSMLSLFRLIADLPKNARILEPGCGLGRVAYALVHYLEGTGWYDGFDVSERAIQIAQSIFSESKRASFQHVDLYNKMYNASGTILSRAFTFPFPASHFDFIVLTSVFTHMLPGDVRRFLFEIARTLVTGGTCFATFFALDDLAKINLHARKTALAIVHPLAEGCFVENPATPENAVAYDYGTLVEMTNDAGLKIEQVHWGKWSGRSRFLSYQDIFLLRKT
mgnify:CR=1 FL=1